eukprot:XP_011444990.2 PREDICTED: metalloproteinase inhibitor 2-like [Crassostrea gigas]
MRVDVLLFLVFACCVRPSTSCSCFPTHVQTSICQADYAIKATILSVQDSGDFTLRYNVTVEMNFKTGQPTPSSVISIFTANNSALCGVYFSVGETYLIVGNIVNGEYRTNLCFWNIIFSDLSDFQMFALKRRIYVNNCECEIYQCFGLDCQSEADCIVPPEQTYCYYSNKACTKRGAKCSWTDHGC